MYPTIVSSLTLVLKSVCLIDARGILYPLIRALYQVEGACLPAVGKLTARHKADASFNDFLDEIDPSYCTYEVNDSIHTNFPGSCGSLPCSAVISAELW